MAKQPLQTIPTKKSVTSFIASVKDPQQRKDSQTVIAIMRKVTGERPVMWGPSVVGFGQYHYVYASGREGDWMLTGFSPRKGTLSLYLMLGLTDETGLRAKLGSHKTGKGCLYLKSLEGIDLKVLEELVRRCVRKLRKNFP